MTSKSNNFDLIRLVAALQVVVVHSLHHLGLASDLNLAELLTRFFPGVPVFFFVSGFLITQSFDKNPSIVDFTLNRCLRIYPALIVCFLVSVLSVFAMGYFRSARTDWIEFAGWTAAQLSFLQFYNPDFMRHYGSGVMNGSMWTISVELQFYVLTPLIHKFMHSRMSAKFGKNSLCIALILVFMTANQIYDMLLPMRGESMSIKLVGVTFIPWLYMFLAGALVQYNFAFFHAKLSGKFLPVFVAYVAIALLAERWLGWGFGNSLNPVFFLGLMFVLFAAAFSYPRLSDHLLRRNDISYGVYIYHMPVINLLLVSGYGGSIKGAWIGMSVTIALGLVSWLLVEKPALAFKRHPLYRHATANR
jgi:peptidoglycan/LPS O-acetylase OafA/YrhL